MATQESRRGSLPGAAELRANLRQAIDGLAVDAADRLQPFLERRRGDAPCRPGDARGIWQGTSLARRIRRTDSASEGSMECACCRCAAARRRRQSTWRGSRRRCKRAGPRGAGARSQAGIRRLVCRLLVRGDSFVAGGRPGARRAAVDRFAFAAARRHAYWRRWCWRCSPWPPALRACGVQLTILHLVGMLLIVAVGSNYALFFDRQARVHEAGQRVADPRVAGHRQLPAP